MGSGAGGKRNLVKDFHRLHVRREGGDAGDLFFVQVDILQLVDPWILASHLAEEILEFVTGSDDRAADLTNP